MEYHRLINMRVFLGRPMGKFAEELGHLKTHVKYPATKADVVTACNNNMHADRDDADWIATALPEGTYRGASDVLVALLNKV